MVPLFAVIDTRGYTVSIAAARPGQPSVTISARCLPSRPR